MYLDVSLLVHGHLNGLQAYIQT